MLIEKAWVILMHCVPYLITFRSPEMQGWSLISFVVFLLIKELAAAGSDYDSLVCAESKVSDRRHLCELRNPGFGCPQQRLNKPGAQGMALDVRERLMITALE